MIAPTPHGQIYLVRSMMDGLAKGAYDDPLETAASFYNAFADTPSYELPHIDKFPDMQAATSALERLEARLEELFGSGGHENG